MTLMNGLNLDLIYELLPRFDMLNHQTLESIEEYLKEVELDGSKLFVSFKKNWFWKTDNLNDTVHENNGNFIQFNIDFTEEVIGYLLIGKSSDHKPMIVYFESKEI